MAEADSKLIIGLIIGATILYFFALLLMLQIRYSTFLEQIRKNDPDWREDLGGLIVGKNGGKFISGFSKYWFRSPVSINCNSADSSVQDAIIKHDKLIKLFWISAVIILPVVIIICNLID
jgi:hypothetical protein